MQIVIQNQLISYVGKKTAGDKCLLFLHGWRSQKEIWQPIIRQLSVINNQLSVYAIDLPGFGSSSAPQESWSVNNYAEVVKGFIEKLDLKNVIIVGHSFGGRVGIKLANNLSVPRVHSGHLPSPAPTVLSGPEEKGLISKLVLVDSAGFAMDESKKAAYAQLAKIVKLFFKPQFMQGLRKKIYQLMDAEDYVATPELRQTFVNIVNEDLTEDVKRINIPTLIIWGENDKETPVEFGTRMQNLINNSILSSDGIALSNDRAKFIILPNAGHFSFLDQPEEFVNLISNFIKYE